MNLVILQIWEISSLKKDPSPDGCSIHINMKERDSYVNKIYESRIGKKVPNSYERIIGSPIEAFVEDGVFSLLSSKKNLRLSQIELNNLVRFEEISIKEL